MAYYSSNPMFRSLDDEQEKEFREWAEKNDPERMEDWNIYHPVCREVWTTRGFKP